MLDFIRTLLAIGMVAGGIANAVLAQLWRMGRYPALGGPLEPQQAWGLTAIAMGIALSGIGTLAPDESSIGLIVVMAGGVLSLTGIGMLYRAVMGKQRR